MGVVLGYRVRTWFFGDLARVFMGFQEFVILSAMVVVVFLVLIFWDEGQGV